MARQELRRLGVVRVDLRATQARQEVGASCGGKHDTRLVLYTNELQSRHRYVRVQRQEDWATAELRASVDGANWISAGLLAALAVESESKEQRNEQDHFIQVELFTVEDPVEKAKCTCSPGTVTSVRLHFVSRARPSRTVVAALERVVYTALHRELVWSGKRSRISWLNTAEVVEFHEVQRGSTGRGCCADLASCSTETLVSLSFQNDKPAAGDALASDSFLPVEEYTRRVEATMGGVGGHVARVLSAMIARLSVTSAISSSRLPASVGAILSGLPGIGKTALAKAICDSISGVHVRFLNATDVFQTYVGHSEAQLVRTFEELAQHAPSILVVDGLEAVATSRQRFLDSDSTLEVGVLGTFVSCLENLKASRARVFVLGTTSRIDDIDAAVYSNGRLDVIVKMEPPSQKERHEILARVMRGWALDPSVPDHITKLSESTGGFVGADLLSMCQSALQCCLNDPTRSDQHDPVIVLPRHFDAALASTYPSVLQAHHVSLRKLEATAKTSTNPFHGIYGVDEALRMITVSLLEPLQDCRRFLQFGTVPPKGILLTGPPGSGKTHLANVVAAELRRQGLASFISVRCTDLLTKVVGDTEKALRDLFETARSATPCVIYFDQIESIAPVRGFDTSTEQTFDRLLSMLLVEMDGFSTSSESLRSSVNSDEARTAFLKHHVVILASTTSKKQLDPAILRPGRFDIHIDLDLPNREARQRIFRDALQDVPVEYTTDSDLSSPELLAAFVADHTDGFAAGDLTSLLREATITAMREHFDVPAIATRFIRDALHEHQVLRVSSQIN